MDVALSKFISANDIEGALRSFLPELDVRIRSCFSEAENEKCTVVYEQIQGDYPVLLSFSMSVLENQECLHLVCFELSHQFECDVWCADELYALDSSPYWSVVYRNGVGYLVDDSAHEYESVINSNDLRFVEKIPTEKLTKSVQERLSKSGKL